MNHPSFAERWTACAKQEKKGAQQTADLHMLNAHQVFHGVRHSVKHESCLMSHITQKSIISTNVSCYQTSCGLQLCHSTGQCTGESSTHHSPTAAVQKYQLHLS